MSQTIFITGLNGFVAVHVALSFLQKGWKVKGTVRSSSKIEHTILLPVFKPWARTDALEVVVVADLATADLSEHLKGVDAVGFELMPG